MSKSLEKELRASITQKDKEIERLVDLSEFLLKEVERLKVLAYRNTLKLIEKDINSKQ